MKTGDKIIVSNDNNYWQERIYLYKLGEYFYCDHSCHEKKFKEIKEGAFYEIKSEPWKFAKEIPTPTYRPYTMKEFTVEWVKRGCPEFSGRRVNTIYSKFLSLNSGSNSDWGYEEILDKLKWQGGDVMGVEVKV